MDVNKEVATLPSSVAQSEAKSTASSAGTTAGAVMENVPKPPDLYRTTANNNTIARPGAQRITPFGVLL